MQYKALVGRQSTLRLRQTEDRQSLMLLIFPSPITFELIIRYAPMHTKANAESWAIS